MKGLEEKAFHPQNNNADEILDFSSFKFPINNYDYNLVKIDSNDNLSNIIFLEFDINSNNISKEHLKYFREVNNDFVDKEIHFVLNVLLI
jgi:hypothetical protein